MKVYEMMQKLSEFPAGSEVVFDSILYKSEIEVFDDQEGTVRVCKKIEELDETANGEVFIS